MGFGQSTVGAEDLAEIRGDKPSIYIACKPGASFLATVSPCLQGGRRLANTALRLEKERDVLLVS